MESIRKDGLLSRTLVKKINDYLSKNSFKEKIQTKRKKITAISGNFYLERERYFITNNYNKKIYLGTLKDVKNKLLGYDVLKYIIENY